MKKISKNTIMISLGFLGGMSSWPLLEMILSKQSSFSNYLIFFIMASLVPGFFMGLFMGCGEGLLNKSLNRILKGAFIGLVVGTLGGISGGFIGQILLVKIIQYFPNSSQALVLTARTCGWALVGLFVGLSEGIRSLSLRKMLLGGLGGVLGGAMGGFTLELFSRYWNSSSLLRLVGLLLMGTMISVFYTFFDKKYSFGVLRVLNGSQAGKKYRINQKKMDLGSGNRTMIFTDYDGVDDKEIELSVNKGVITVIGEKDENNLYVNEKPTNKTQLKYGDVIKAGSVKLLLEAE
jgi:hypothetical protein